MPEIRLQCRLAVRHGKGVGMEKNSGGGITFGGGLQIAFIVLKLLGVIKWSWIWVLCPMWIGTIILAIAFVFLIWANK